MLQNKITLKNSLLVVLLVLASSTLFLTLMSFNDVYDGLRLGKHYGIIISFIIFTVVALLIYLFTKLRPQTLNLADLFLFAYLSFILIRGSENGNVILNEKFIWYSCTILLYYIFKFLFSHTLFIKTAIVCISLAVSYQAILGCMQLYKLAPTNFTGHITGSFFNPALLGGYLASIFPFLLSINSKFSFTTQQFSKGKWIELIVLPALLLILIALPITLSRAAWIGGISGTLCVLFHHNHHRGLINYYYGLKKKIKLLLIAAFISAILVSLFGIYIMKKDSANGRALMWKVTAIMWSKAPIIGHGFDAINEHYLDFQADYFKTHAHTDNEEMLAGNVHWSFNEFLQMGSESGFVGVTLFWGWLILLLFAKTKNTVKPYVIGAKGGIIALITVSMFSYPFYSPPIFLNLIFFASIISFYSKPLFDKKSKRPFFKYLAYIPLTLCIVFALFYTQNLKPRYHAYWLWDEANQLYNISEYKVANKSFKEAYPILRNNGKFLINYGKSLEMAEDYMASNSMLLEAKIYWSDEVLYNTLGNTYKALGNFQKAEEAYKHASFIIPHKFYPHYLMFKMYSENGETDKTIEKANYIKNKPVKIHSKALEEIYEEIEAYILKKDTLDGKIEK